MRFTVFLYVYFPEALKPEIIPGLPVRWYGLMYLLAFFVTWVLFKYQVKEEGIAVSDDEISNLFFSLILGLILGARIFSALIYDTSGIYWHKPWLIFWPFSNGHFTGLQGMSYHGGLVGAVLGGAFFCYRKKWFFPAMGDRIVAGVPLGYTFGRLGNFINGELFGRVTTSPLGMVFPHAERLIPVKTTSCPPIVLKSLICSKISAKGIVLCCPLFCTVRQKVQ